MRFCFDIDGTICSTNGLDYSDSQPFLDRVEHINSLYEKGNHIIIFTARGTLSGIDHTVLTQSQLSLWGLKYHELILGKPAADVYIDDKGRNSEEYDWGKSSQL
jgi:hypothetical protein